MSYIDTVASVDTRFSFNLEAVDFPFVCELSLEPLVRFWQQYVSQAPSGQGRFAAGLHDALAAAPALLEPIVDLSTIAAHQELVEALMALIFPPASWEQLYAAALIPYQLRSVYATPSFARQLMAADGMLQAHLNVDDKTIAQVRVMHAYAHILHRVYGVDLNFDYPLIFTTTDPATGLEQHFKPHWGGRFVDVKTVGTLPSLSAATQKHLLANLHDLPVVMDILPPERFLLQGFTVLTLTDVTDQEVLSSLKRDLIDRESIVSGARFQKLQDKLRTLFRQPGLSFGIAALQGEEVYVLNSRSVIQHGCIFADSQHYNVTECLGSIYEQAVRQGEVLIIDDLLTYPQRSSVEDCLIEQGVRNIVVAPLYYQDELIGTLELSSAQPGELNAMNAMKLREVLPLFSIAVKRSMEELNARIQTIIKEQCTAIHPAVEWRFRQAAMHWVQGRQEGMLQEMEPIVFDAVYPLYGVSDIRGSSTQRNAAIQADLILQLELARDVLLTGYGVRPLPILQALAYHVGRHVTRLEAGLGSGDESAIVDFLRRDVEPLFGHMQGFASEVQECIDRYRQALDTPLGTVYRQRRDFEESVTMLNETLSAYLHREQERAQAMFPHYFEVHKSDGVEHSIYVGAALVEHGQFDTLYLHNLRLWQLMAMIGLARQAVHLRERLPVPLDTAHLILVQHTPLSIRFRFDERRFDVDGAYNAHYEIMKKRIDKAVLRGTQERLTQPGKIAIVYSQPKEAVEYREYIAYLQAAGYLTADVEECELDDLQGVDGLQALRVTVACEDEGCSQASELADLIEVAGTVSRVMA